jgi:2-polyprenyl-3-methyl-5-hydroxy-6-metoxy-1,4-benzoquinol methylase
MSTMRALFVSVIACAACHDHAQQPPPVQSSASGMLPMQAHPFRAMKTAQLPDETLDAEREEYITDAMAFLKLDRDTVVKNLDPTNPAMKNDWEAWEKQGPMTDDRIKQFYKQTKAYIWDLGAWHLWGTDGKRQSDVAMVQQMKDAHVKTILDFGGGVGMNGMMMARAGFDVTVADLDSTTLAFAKFRAERHNVKMKFWKSDVEPMPPEPKYDVILCLDVLEHLPQKELQTTVDKLVQLKTPTTQIIIHAPFGKTATHPMHLDATEETKRQVMRLQTELPKT